MIHDSKPIWVWRKINVERETSRIGEQETAPKKQRNYTNYNDIFGCPMVWFMGFSDKRCWYVIINNSYDSTLRLGNSTEWTTEIQERNYITDRYKQFTLTKKTDQSIIVINLVTVISLVTVVNLVTSTNACKVGGDDKFGS